MASSCGLSRTGSIFGGSITTFSILRDGLDRSIVLFPFHSHHSPLPDVDLLSLHQFEVGLQIRYPMIKQFRSADDSKYAFLVFVARVIRHVVITHSAATDTVTAILTVYVHHLCISKAPSVKDSGCCIRHILFAYRAKILTHLVSSLLIWPASTKLIDRHCSTGDQQCRK